MRGISFKRDSGCKNILWSILNGIEIENLWWHISEDEIYDNMFESIFHNSYVNGKTFLNIIKEKDYSVVFANIKAYSSKITPSYIETYDDFIKSECQLVILCSDARYYEVYAKSRDTIETIKNNVNSINACEVEYITEENDGRIIFSVG